MDQYQIQTTNQSSSTDNIGKFVSSRMQNNNLCFKGLVIRSDLTDDTLHQNKDFTTACNWSLTIKMFPVNGPIVKQFHLTTNKSTCFKVLLQNKVCERIGLFFFSSSATTDCLSLPLLVSVLRACEWLWPLNCSMAESTLPLGRECE